MHYQAAQRLEAAGDEWAAVCYFYAAFMAARSCLYADVRLDSDANARAADPKLSASSRHVDFHNGHRSRGPGMNEVVATLYPKIGAQYELLHIKSVEVRYDSGLQNATIDDVRQVADLVIAELRAAGAPLPATTTP